MKVQYKLGLMAAGVLLLSSCEKHDLVADNMQIGQYVPTCYWEVGSTACKAGDSFTFKGKYYTEDGHTPDHSEVWYSVSREETKVATLKLAGTLMAYAKTTTTQDEVRTAQVIAEFGHDLAVWNGTEFEITGSVPTSNTLSPVVWGNLVEWDQKRFNEYLSADFAAEFNAEVIDKLTSDANYEALRKVYCDYPFSNDSVLKINSEYGTNLPTDIVYQEGDPQAAVTEKSDRWYQTAEADPDKIIGYYYKNAVNDSTTVAVEVSLSDVTIAEDGSVTYNLDSTIDLYPVYDAAEWVFCRYDDDQGAIISSVREAYIPAFAALLEQIKFEEWIYDGKNYAVSFTRDYILNATFKVFDTAGNEGKASNVYDISIN